MGTQPRDLPSDTRGIQRVADKQRDLKILAILDEIKPPNPEEIARRREIMKWNEANPNNKKPIAQIQHWGKISEAEGVPQGVLTELRQNIRGGFGMPAQQRILGRHDTRPPPPKVPETEQQRMKRIQLEDSGVPELRDIRQDLWPDQPWLDNPHRAKIIREYKALDPNARDAYREKHFDNYQWPRGSRGDLYRSMIEEGKVPRE